MSKVKTPKGELAQAPSNGTHKPQRQRGGQIRYQWSQLGEEVCRRLANGESLLAICRTEGMPERNTIYGWVEEHEGFRRQFARARGLSADTAVSDMLALADDESLSIGERRLRIDTRERYAKLVSPAYRTNYTETHSQVRVEVDREAILLAAKVLTEDVIEAEYQEVEAGPPPLA